MSLILVVEDESAIAELIAINLRHAGFEVAVASDADAAQAAVDRVLPDLVLLDWMLPGQSGVQLARRWRTVGRTRDLPLIMLTARAEEADKITGLDSGADDYLTKPFSTKELLARIRAVLRRKAPEALDEAVEVAGLRLDPATRRVSRGEVELKIPAGSQPSDKLLMRGRGVRRLDGGTSGSQYVHLRVDVPRSLTPRQRELMAEYAKLEGAGAGAGEGAAGGAKKGFLQETIERIRRAMAKDAGRDGGGGGGKTAA